MTASTANNFLLSIVKSIKPQDEIEAMLASQMAVVHATTMMLARRLNQSELIPQQDSAERALNKLARTFTSQMEALNRHRGKGVFRQPEIDAIIDAALDEELW
jgi:hypothetical protein